MKKNKFNLKVVIIVLVAVIVLMTSVLVGTLLFGKKAGANDNVITEVVSDDKYYSIRSNATDLQKELYEQLNDEIKNGNMKDSSALLVENFVVDFFTLSNKTIKNDVGGIQFWNADSRLNVRDKAINSIYFYFELLCRDYGLDQLPEVSSVTIEYAVEMEEKGRYYVALDWTYAEKAYDTSEYSHHGEAVVDTNSEIPYILSFQ